MAKLKVSDDVLKNDIYAKEAYVVGLAWSDPTVYDHYPIDKFNKNHFGNTIWKFFWGLGRYMFEKGVTIFDDITVYTTVAELKQEENFDKFGGYDTVEELVEELNGKESNFEAYYHEIKKYALLREYRNLFGKKVLEPNGKYDYKKMSLSEIEYYWNDKLNSVSLEMSDVNNEAFNLLGGLKDLVKNMKENPDQGLPFHKSKRLSGIINGWALGTVSILSAFSGNGKSSFVLEKIILSCIINKEKLLVIANEMDIAQYQKLILLTLIGADLYKKIEGEEQEDILFSRQSLNRGDFSQEEEDLLYRAIEWVEESIGEDEGLIKFLPLEDYTMDNVENNIRYYARRGYSRVIIDTCKPSEDRGNMSRWEKFVDDFDRLYKLARKGKGGSSGLNLAIFTTVQSADSAIGLRYLDERVIGEAKKIKNIADTVWHMRPVFDEEKKGGSQELKVRQSYSNDKLVTLHPMKTYYLLFTSKNRRGQTNITGLDVLVYRVDFNSNSWKEVGWVKVPKDSY